MAIKKNTLMETMQLLRLKEQIFPEIHFCFHFKKITLYTHSKCDECYKIWEKKKKS